ELGDPRFIIPLRLEPFKEVFGIGGVEYVDFVRGWAGGLDKLLSVLKKEKGPCKPGRITLNPKWEISRRGGAILIKEEPERLTSNWLRIQETPDCINYLEPTGAIDRDVLMRACGQADFRIALMQRGIVSFQSESEVNAALAGVGRFAVKEAVP